MRDDPSFDLHRRATVHAALADAARLRIVDTLTLGDASPSELAHLLGMPSNLVAHHLGVLEQTGLVSRHRSEGDGRRTYVRLVDRALDGLLPGPNRRARRVLFVCTANSARSHLAAALWRRSSGVPSASAGTHPADRISPGAVTAAARHGLPMRRLHPRPLGEVLADGDLVVTVCDRAHEELDVPADVHWSVADPVRVGTPEAFDAALDELARRVRQLAPLVVPAT
ncbi:MAG: ArsR family transcriptional regulator [Microbacterium sp. 14-71-5]|jgi:protein-tyrosine-phosphatase|nr:MAG: ArsR family transcriptional regulator [Microbacterium sp. 14-71-5]